MSRSVTIAAGRTQVLLPNGSAYNAGQTVVLTDEQFDQIEDDLFPDWVIDNGPVGTDGDEVVVQGAAVAAPAALTSADAAASPPTDVEFNALRADVVALHGSVTDLIAALSGSGRPLP